LSDTATKLAAGGRRSRIAWRIGWFALLILSAVITYGLVVFGGK